MHILFDGGFSEETLFIMIGKTFQILQIDCHTPFQSQAVHDHDQPVSSQTEAVLEKAAPAPEDDEQEIVAPPHQAELAQAKGMVSFIGPADGNQGQDSPLEPFPPGAAL